MIRRNSMVTAAADEARMAAVSKADLGAIAQNEFVGTAAVPMADGSPRALEVHLFPESMRGTGEGHRPWDLGAGSTMTNANVAKVSKEAGTPVVRLSPADRSVLVPGARAFAAGPAGPDGTVTAGRVFAGVGGAEPPM